MIAPLAVTVEIRALDTGPRLERAIGVIYLPETERASHYFDAMLPRQFDAVIHIDETSALDPLERIAPEKSAEAPTLAGMAGLKKGDQVKVKEGPFENYEGEIDEVMMVPIFSSETVVPR